MLLLLLGPSGVGKTSVIQILDEEYGCRCVTSYITRPTRLNEKYKTTLSVAEYNQRLSQNRFFSHVEQLGYMYGTPREEIELAITSNDFWVLDFSVDRYRSAFSAVNNLAFIILPESEDQLRRQLESVGRQDRIEGAVNEMRTKFQDAHREELGLNDSVMVVNRENDLSNTAQTIFNVSQERATKFIVAS